MTKLQSNLQGQQLAAVAVNRTLTCPAMLLGWSTDYLPLVSTDLSHTRNWQFGYDFTDCPTLLTPERDKIRQERIQRLRGMYFSEHCPKDDGALRTLG